MRLRIGDIIRASVSIGSVPSQTSTMTLSTAQNLIYMVASRILTLNLLTLGVQRGAFAAAMSEHLGSVSI